MKTPLSAIGRELYEQLTARTLYVVDTEFSTDDDGEHHLISIGIVPVVGGHRTKTGDELYRVMHPGVPIDDVSTRIHGFTDADVAGKRHFDYYAPVILERLREDDAVFVCHSTIDAHVLRSELERLSARAAAGETGIKTGLSHLPVLPVLDTQRLAPAVAYPGVGKTTKISLDKLCDLTGVQRTQKAHDAREDARATANALIELLRHTAEKCVFWTFEDLLAAADGGTTHEPKGPAHIRSRPARAPELPAQHLAKHIYPMTDPVADGSPEAEQWLDRAAECAGLRCPHLRDEANAAALHNGAILLRPLMDDLPHMTAPGTAGTLLGAVYELLICADQDSPTLPKRRALYWWKAARPAIRASVACDRGSAATSCPSCQEGEPCPRDLVFAPVAEIVATAGSGRMTEKQARDVLSPHERSPLNTWRKNHGDVLAYTLWRIARYLFDEGEDERAYSVVDQGIAMDLHTIEPRFCELAGERLVETGQAATALATAQALLAQRTTDPAYDDLASWILFTENALYAQQPAARKTITHPRRARPEGHTNPRLYS